MNSLTDPTFVSVTVGLLAVGAAVYYLNTREAALPKKLPGRLQAEGSFELKNEAVTKPEGKDRDSFREEKERDFRRLAKARTDFFGVIAANKESMDNMPVVQVPSGQMDDLPFGDLIKGLVAATFDEDDASTLLDLSVHGLFSATTPFEVAMMHGVLPQFAQPRYVLVRGTEPSTYHFAWAAFVTDVPTPDFKCSPFVLCVLSEALSPSLLAARKPQIAFTYSCCTTRAKDIALPLQAFLRARFQ